MGAFAKKRYGRLSERVAIFPWSFIVLSTDDYELESLMTAKDLDTCTTVEELIEQIGERVSCLKNH